MRKFKARWWVEDPTAHYQNVCDGLNGPGISIRYISAFNAAWPIRQEINGTYYDSSASRIVE